MPAEDDDQQATPPERDEHDTSWLQLPTVEPYITPTPLTTSLAETGKEAPKPGRTTAKVPTPPKATAAPAAATTPPPATPTLETASQTAVMPTAGKPTAGSQSTAKRVIPSLPRESAKFLAVHAAEFAPVPETNRLPAVQGEVATDARSPVVFIRGSGVSMGEPFVKRRRRPLGMRLTIYIAAACTVISGLFGVSALSGSDPVAAIRSLYETANGSTSSALTVSFVWYVAQSGDTVEGVATRFHVQPGGIFELNNMRADQELQLGQKYKVPTDPFYGKTFRPTEPPPQGNGSTTFGNDWWNSYAGTPIKGQYCSPSGPKPTDYQMVAPNPGSNWVRGYTWYHLGIDSAGPYGEPIVAAQRGLVIWAGWTDLGYGWSVVISHCNHVSTLYGHMAKILVKAGQNVVAGQPVGLEGSTGWSTGPHLHFSLFWDNQYVDPMPYYNNSEANFLRPCSCYTPPN